MSRTDGAGMRASNYIQRVFSRHIDTLKSVVTWALIYNHPDVADEAASSVMILETIQKRRAALRNAEIQLKLAIVAKQPEAVIHWAGQWADACKAMQGFHENAIDVSPANFNGTQSFTPGDRQTKMLKMLPRLEMKETLKIADAELQEEIAMDAAIGDSLSYYSESSYSDASTDPFSDRFSVSSIPAQRSAAPSQHSAFSDYCRSTLETDESDFNYETFLQSQDGKAVKVCRSCLREIDPANKYEDTPEEALPALYRQWFLDNPTRGDFAVEHYCCYSFVRCPCCRQLFDYDRKIVARKREAAIVAQREEAAKRAQRECDIACFDDAIREAVELASANLFASGLRHREPLPSIYSELSSGVVADDGDDSGSNYTENIPQSPLSSRACSEEMLYPLTTCPTCSDPWDDTANDNFIREQRVLLNQIEDIIQDMSSIGVSLMRDLSASDHTDEQPQDQTSNVSTSPWTHLPENLRGRHSDRSVEAAAAGSSAVPAAARQDDAAALRTRLQWSCESFRLSSLDASDDGDGADGAAAGAGGDRTCRFGKADCHCHGDIWACKSLAAAGLHQYVANS